MRNIRLALTALLPALLVLSAEAAWGCRDTRRNARERHSKWAPATLNVGKGLTGFLQRRGKPYVLRQHSKQNGTRSSLEATYRYDGRQNALVLQSVFQKDTSSRRNRSKASFVVPQGQRISSRAFQEVLGLYKRTKLPAARKTLLGMMSRHIDWVVVQRTRGRRDARTTVKAGFDDKRETIDPSTVQRIRSLPMSSKSAVLEAVLDALVAR